VRIFKNIGKWIGIAFIGIIVAFVTIVGGLTVFHHVSLAMERGQLENPGQLVTVNGNKMNIYARGEQNGNPTLLFISGAGTASPIYNFMPLLNLLPDYKLVVVERFGYGYSDIVNNLDRSISSILSDTREALTIAEIHPPFILLPHSMGGLEALYWANKYPTEVEAIIGLDMATPDSYKYLDFDSEKAQIEMAMTLKFFGLSRIMGNTQGTTDLTSHQKRQQSILGHRNFVNTSLVAEGLALLDNIEAVKESIRENGIPNIPMLLFTSHGKDIDNHWLPSQQNFAQKTGSRLIELYVGHYVFQYQPQQIATEIIKFVEELS